MSDCAILTENASAGVAPALRAVDGSDSHAWWSRRYRKNARTDASLRWTDVAFRPRCSSSTR